MALLNSIIAATACMTCDQMRVALGKIRAKYKKHANYEDAWFCQGEVELPGIVLHAPFPSTDGLEIPTTRGTTVAMSNYLVSYSPTECNRLASLVMNQVGKRFEELSVYALEKNSSFVIADLCSYVTGAVLAVGCPRDSQSGREEFFAAFLRNSGLENVLKLDVGTDSIGASSTSSILTTQSYFSSGIRILCLNSEFQMLKEPFCRTVEGFHREIGVLELHHGTFGEAYDKSYQLCNSLCNDWIVELRNCRYSVSPWEVPQCVDIPVHRPMLRVGTKKDEFQIALIHCRQGSYLEVQTFSGRTTHEAVLKALGLPCEEWTGPPHLRWDGQGLGR